MLLREGADVNARDSKGEVALHFAAREHHPGIVRALLDAGATVDSQDNEGNTPLGNAVYESRGRGDVIQLLVARGAAKDLKNNHGVSPIELAKMIANYDVKQFLR